MRSALRYPRHMPLLLKRHSSFAELPNDVAILTTSAALEIAH